MKEAEVFQESKKLEKLVKERSEEEVDKESDFSFFAEYLDVETTLLIIEESFELALQAKGRPVFRVSNGGAFFFFVGTEDEVAARLLTIDKK